MIHETALRLAGPHARLVARPGGVAHIYTGPLTPSGRWASGRPLCRARTRRLTTVSLPAGWSSLSPSTGGPSLPRLCARCSVALPEPGAAEQHLTTRTGFLAEYADLTPFDLVLAAKTADTAEELDQVAHLSLALFGHLACTQPVQRPDGVLVEPLHHHVIRGRTRVDGWPGDVAARAALHDQLSEEAAHYRKQAARAAREETASAWDATRAPRTPHPEGAPA